jgi:hypothetical protein
MTMRNTDATRALCKKHGVEIFRSAQGVHLIGPNVNIKRRGLRSLSAADFEAIKARGRDKSLKASSS